MSDQVLLDVAYVCTIGIRGRDRVFIPAGRSFIKEALVEHSFNRLQEQGYLERFQIERPIQPIGKAIGHKLSGIDNETPDAAINPPKQTNEQKIASIRAKAQVVADAKAEKASKAADAAIVMANRAAAKAEDEAKAQKALTESEAKKKPASSAEPKKESTVEQIWIHDPASLKDVKFAQLLSGYRTECEKFDIEPKVFNEGDKNLLIKQLSSQWQKK